MIRLRLERRRDSTGKFTWAEIKETLADFLVIFFGVWLLGHLVLFWIGGWIVLGEPSKLWLALETVMALGIIALGIDRWRSHSRAK